MRTWADWASDEIARYMGENPKALLIGIGVADGKTWACGLGRAAAQQYPSRVWDAPACEATLTGMLIGLSDCGWHPILVHCREQFALLGKDQLETHAYKWEALYGRQPNITVIEIIGDIKGQGPQHAAIDFPWDVSSITVFPKWLRCERAEEVLMSLHKLRSPCE